MNPEPYTLADSDLVFDLLLSPSCQLRKEWSAYLQTRYKHRGDERLYYFDMMEISAMIVRCFKHKRIKTVCLFFRQVELLLEKGDPEIRNLVAAGLIEGIQQICAYDERIDMRHDFEPWLLPLTKAEWHAQLSGFYKRT